MEENQNAQMQPEDSQAGMDTFFADTTVKTPAPEKKKKMSGSVKALIAAVIALAVLGGGLAAMQLLQNKGDASTDSSEEDTESTTETDESLVLNPNESGDVVKVEISNTTDFTVYLLTEETDTESAVYTIEGLEDLTLDSSLLSTLVNNGSDLSAAQLVEENPEDLSKYGLAEPASVVTLTYADGAVFTMQIGDQSPLDSTYTYCETDGKVYLVKTSLMANYKKADTSFISKTVLAEPDDEDYPIVESVRIEREDLDYDIYLEYDYDLAEDDSTGGTAATHVMKEPVSFYLDVESSTDVTNGMFGLTAGEIAAVHPTEEELAQAGITEESFCTVTMVCDDGNTYVLRLGDTYTTEDGTVYYYAYLEGVNLLYGVTEDNAVWATVQPGDIISGNIISTYVWDIATLDVSVGDSKLSFVGAGEDQDSYVVTKNGETCDTERFRLFYRFLLGIYGEDTCIGESVPESEPDASVHLTSQDGKEDYTVEFYKLTSIKTLVTINGVSCFTIRTSCLDTLTNNIEIFDDTNEDFVTTWQ
jgi:hypothetical protein